MPYDAFLSYHGRDREAVEAVARALTERHGLNVLRSLVPEGGTTLG
jgi:hypothetical protein